MRLLLVLLLLTACSLDDEGTGQQTGHFTTRPVYVQASSALPDACFESLFRDVLWYRARGVTLALTVVDPGTPSVNGIPVRGVVGIYAGVPQRPSSLAETKRAYTVGGDIYSAEVVLRMGDARSCDALAIAHELGHALGLLDNDEGGNLMHRYLDRGGWALTADQLAWISD